jgi:hypothetical protein
MSCVVCGDPNGHYVSELHDFLCDDHLNEFIDWKSNNPYLPPSDYLSQKIDDREHQKYQAELKRYQKHTEKKEKSHE